MYNYVVLLPASLCWLYWLLFKQYYFLNSPAEIFVDGIKIFDDHQNALERVKEGKEFGFKQFIFEDNYPVKQGDCYSLKKAFQHAGFISSVPKTSLKQKIIMLIKPGKVKNNVITNSEDADYLKSLLEIYYEFPPVLKKEKTRWLDDWDENYYPTPEPLFSNAEHDFLKIFEEEAIFYTWICYAKLK